jgi:RNA polymerase sigma-70 factor (ECF subfamily)
MRTCLRNPVEAEDLTQDVFAKALEALPEYELRPGRPFLGWLFRVSRNTAIDALRREQGIELTDPAALDQAREQAQDDDSDETAEQAELALNWLTDRDLAFLVERLPEVQRQVLTMKFLLDLPTDEIAQFTGRTPKAVRQLQSRALRYLEERLTALGRRGDMQVKRTPTLSRIKPMPVTVSRRFALGKGPPRER